MRAVAVAMHDGNTTAQHINLGCTEMLQKRGGGDVCMLYVLIPALNTQVWVMHVPTSSSKLLQQKRLRSYQARWLWGKTEICTSLHMAAKDHSFDADDTLQI